MRKSNSAKRGGLWRISKLVEYRRQTWRLAHLVGAGTLKKTDAVDGLWEIAIAHALVRSLGEDRIQAILAEAFAGVEFLSDSKRAWVS
jgi:hypothetical protein